MQVSIHAFRSFLVINIATKPFIPSSALTKIYINIYMHLEEINPDKNVFFTQ